MLDFMNISMITIKGVIEIRPRFLIKKSDSLMIRGGDFYAIFDKDTNKWSTDEDDAVRLIDNEIRNYFNEHKAEFQCPVKVLYLRDADSGMIDNFHKYVQKQLRDNFKMLDERLIFSNTELTRTDYASKVLPYPLEKGSIENFDKLIGVLYSDGERHKLEWCIGAIVSGDSKRLQKFAVLYGSAGTGKSTMLNIIQMLFEGYYSVFDAKALGSSSNAFALEAFKTNPLVAIQHDGDLSRIEDNTRLNSLVSHEQMTVNEKFKSAYSNSFKSFLFMGTNKPVKITDAKSGLIRRLIDISPSGNKLTVSEYNNAFSKIPFELGAIAKHCLDIYTKNKHYYDTYVPIAMLGASNDFYNFVMDHYVIFKKEDGTTLKIAWEMYKTYCEETKCLYPLSQRSFKEELKNYFKEFHERLVLEDGTRSRNVYSKFITDKFDDFYKKEEDVTGVQSIEFKEQSSIFDKLGALYPAQVAVFVEAINKDIPKGKWAKCKTTLSDITTSELHYVKLPSNHIVIDFDIPDENGNKSLELNLKAASKFPKTYAELSKSGNGIHLHYFYEGDVSKLENLYSEHIEIKTFHGDASLRRKLSKCNNLEIATINSGLPIKGDNNMINEKSVQNEKNLRLLIERNLRKEIHPGTKPSIDFIHKILEDAYKSELKYDVTDLRNDILVFAMHSTNQHEVCMKIVNTMKFKSDDISEWIDDSDKPIVFYDIEVFPNLLLINWKKQGPNERMVRMINPKPADIEKLLQYRLIGFNCRKYDNHILYGAMLGYDNLDIYKLSSGIVNNVPGKMFGEAYNISYTDIYDFSIKKQSLKKWQIELGIHHKELGLPWDEPVPEEKWLEVSEYCDNDVISSEAVFDHLVSDWLARQILADISGLTVNDTTNQHSTRFIFDGNKKPQSEFNYRFMGVPLQKPEDQMTEEDYICFDEKNRPVFPGYKFEFGKSTYRGEDVGEGGYVYANVGMHGNVALLDVASMHPTSIIQEELFGERYTAVFRAIVDIRLAIKHKNFDFAKTALDGKLAKYLDDISNAKNLANALKLVINSIYGLTSASFEHPFRDNRNKDNIVAKRGSLFMINLKNAVLSKGYTVVHVKTDSIKIADADDYIIEFVHEYGKLYGYSFEHEATYDKICLVNDAVYIAQYKDDVLVGDWTATGTQFAVPYVFKTLFSKEKIEFADLCETKSTTSSLYLDMNESIPYDVSLYEKELEDREYNKKAIGSDKHKPRKLNETFSSYSDEMLRDEIAKGHDYHFIGRVGSFCPIKEGRGGGILYRIKDGKYYAVGGTKGYRWLEAETVDELNKHDDIDISHFDTLAEAARMEISKYGDFEWFVSNKPYDKRDNGIYPF